VDTLKFILEQFEGSVERSAVLPYNQHHRVHGFGRGDLARLMSRMGFKKLLEVGVYRGEYSEILCRTNPQATVYSVDPWKSFRRYKKRLPQGWMDKNRRMAEALLAPFSNNVIVVKSSMEAAADFEDGSLDFVYIDGAHDFDNAMMDIITWSRKVRVGGIVAGHDYDQLLDECRVNEAVLGYTLAYRIDPWFVIGGKGMPEDHEASFMWVKPKGEF
jgi:hypothetical protein